MKKISLVLLLLYYWPLAAQEYVEEIQGKWQQIESLANEDDETATEDDSYWQQLDYLRRHPLDINKASAEELKELNLLGDLPLQNFLRYRNMLGPLISLYELQAIPGWDIGTIQSLLPFIKVVDNEPIPQKLAARLKGGEHSILIRYAQPLEKAAEYMGPSQKYPGNNNKMLFRYRYNYNNTLQWGLLGDKDAGEQFFRGRQKQGFDFYSFHACVAKLGIIKSLVMGDFTVSMGQGLVEWQSMAFGKSAEVLSVKKQAAVLRPYTSAGEYNFHRGAGITLQKNGWELTAFVSVKQADGNLERDSVKGITFISSFPVSGYHRTLNENNDKATVSQKSGGGVIKYNGNNWHIGINTIYYSFSKPVIKAGDPYNLFALNGGIAGNTSLDYSFTYRNMHLFGEAATDIHSNKGFLSGLLISLNTVTDLAFLYRNISRAYQSLNGKAFTENTRPVNENGLYTALSIKPLEGIIINAYADVFKFPWLRFHVNAPGYGRDCFLGVVYKINKQSEIDVRYIDQQKPVNNSINDPITNVIEPSSRRQLRLCASVSKDRFISLQSRVDVIWYSQGSSNPSTGFLVYGDIFLKTRKKILSGNARLQYFETDDYESRIYAFENDMLYVFYIPFFYGKGWRYYVNLNLYPRPLTFVNRIKFSLSVRWSQTIYTHRILSASTNIDTIDSNHLSEIKIQLVITK